MGKNSSGYFTTTSFAAIICIAGLAIGGALQQGTKATASANPVKAYVSSSNGHFTHVINTESQSWETSIGDFSPHDSWRCSRFANAVNNSGTKVFNVNACQTNTTPAIDTSNNTFTQLPFAGTSYLFSKDDQYLYAIGGYYRTKYRLSDNSVVWSVTAPGNRPYATTYTIAASRDDTKIYVPMQDRFQEVGVLDAATGATLTTITHSSWDYPNWSTASPVNNEIYVGTNQGIAVIDSTTNTFTRLIPVTSFPPIAISADGLTFYASNQSVIKKVQMSSGAILATYAVSTNEGGLALTPSGDSLYAVTGSGVSIVRLSDGNITDLVYPTTSPMSTGRTIVMAQRISAPSISLSQSTGSAVRNSAVSSLYTISNSGGAVNSYSVSPALPAGLTLGSSTGLISGTPTGVSASTTYTISGTNAGGTSSATFSLAVSLPVGVPPELSEPIPTDDGFTVEITNYSNVVSYALENYSTLFSFSASTTGGSVSLSNGIVNVSGLAASESATVTVTASRNGYTSRSASKTGSARVPATTTTTSSTTTTVAPTTTIPATTTTVAETIPAPVVTQGKKPVTTTAPSTGPTTTVLNPMQNEGVTTTTEAVRVKGSAIPGAQGITEPGEDAPLEISPEVQAAADEAVSDIFDEPVTVADLSDAVADLVGAADTPEEVAALVGSLLKQDLSDEQFAAVADNVFADNLSDESFVAALDVVFEEPLSDEQFSSVLESVLDEPLSEGQFDDFVDVLDADTISEEQVSAAIDAILENDISDTEAESLAQSERVLESIDGEQATEIFAAIELDGLTDAEGAEIVDAVQNANDDVRGAFEDELNVFEGQFDEYVALNSKIDVGERRTVVAVSVVSTVAVASIAAAVPPPMGGGAPAVRGAMPMGGGAPVGGGSAELAEAIKTESNRIRRISKYKYLNGRRVVDKKNFSKKLILSIMQNSFTLVGFIVVYLTLSGSVRTIAGLATLVAFFSTLYIDMREED